MQRACAPSRLATPVCLFLSLLILASGAISAISQPGHWLTGYYATYNMSVMTPAQVDYSKLTHVIYWPVIPNPNGTLNETPFGLSQTTFNSGATALVADAHAAGAKALIGIGGNADSGASAGFSGATTPANLTAFVNNIVALMQQFGFDGVDINWEEISATSTADNTQFKSFIAALRAKLNTLSPRPLLTMAPAVTSFQAGNVTTQQLIASVYQNFDQLNIQTYVMSGPFCGWETWYNAPLSNGGLDFLLAPGEALPSANGLIASYAAAGIPMSKMAIGLQFDAAIWQGGQGTSTGGVTKPHQTWTNDAANCGNNPAAPSWTTLPYRQMITTLATKAGYSANFDSTADQNWLSYDPSGTGTVNQANDQFVSYDSPQSIAKKGADLLAQEATAGTLGGVMIFELSGDYAGANAAPAAQHPLLNSAYQMANLLPAAVTGLTATPAANSATLNWTAATGAASYNVSFENSHGSGPTGTPISVTTTQAVISNLNPGQLYYFLVQGIDAFGAGASTEVSVTIPAASHAPTNLVATAGVDQVLLNWTAIPGATGYTVSRNPPFTPSASRSPSTHPYTDSGLTPGKPYSYTVASVGAWGTGSASNEASATPFGPLAAPTGLAAVVSPGKVALTWNPSPNATSYYVLRSSVSGSGYTKLATSTTTSATDTANFNGTTTYYYVVVALNGTFQSPYSNQVSAKPLTPLPAAPGTPVATAGPDQVTVQWLAVANAFGYNVLRSTVSGTGYTQVGTTATTSYTDSTAIGGYTYYYVIQATNASGHSANSPQASATPTLPAPTGLTATVSGAFILLSWKAVPGAAGYELLRGIKSGGPYTTQIGQATAATSLQDATAAPGTTYYYVVQAYTTPATNQPAVFSPFSNQATATTSAQSLSAPTGLAAYLAQGGGGANLTWSGVTGATSYNIFRSTASGGPYKMVVNYASATSHLMYRDLPLAGGTYYWVVQAVNSAGTSPYSNQASLNVPNLPIPSVPTFSILVQNGAPNVTANYDGNVLFNFYRSSAKTGPYSLVWTSDIYNFTDNNVVPGSTYYYELTATNNAGTSAFSAPQSTTVPLIPANVKATPGNGQVTLSWTAIPGASSYTIYYGPSTNPFTLSQIAPSNSAVVAGLTNGSLYNFEVQMTAADGVSTGNFSAPVSATPVAAQQTVVWIPDYYGQLLQVRKGSPNAWTAITLPLPATCSPNSVAVNAAYAFVVCNANGTTKDEILVYNAATIRAAGPGTLNVSPLQTYLGGAPGTATQFSELIGSAFDASGNLWIASQGNNNIYSISAASLGTATPAITQQLNNSPSSPAGLAFATDGSLWITGQVYDNMGNPQGIVLNMPSNQFAAGGQNPRYCLLSENLGAGCQSMAGIFQDPEGIAVVGNDIWVANNGVGGNTPGRQLVDLQIVAGSIIVNTLFGNPSSTTASPFVCPGGLFATPVHLWINDESYGQSAANLHCGGNGDVAAMAGGLFDYTPTQLTNKDTTLTDVLAFSNITGRPGFGGIFVENDQ